MFNIERFEKIFGSTSQRKSGSAHSTPINRQKRKMRSVGSEPRKRKQTTVDSEFSQFSLNVTVNKTQSATTKSFSNHSCFLLNDSNQSIDSPDKKNILPHLSCQPEDFDTSLHNLKEETFDESHNDIKTNDFAKRLDLLDPVAFSPNVEEFSESEDLFQISQTKVFLAEANKDIEGIYKQKPKYKPIKKIPKSGGLMEKLRSMKEKRNSALCSFAMSHEIVDEQRKIEIVEYSALCRRLLVRFKFLDEPPDPDNDRHNFFFTSTDFVKLFVKQVIFDVVFESSATREVTKNNIVHFMKTMRASQSFKD